MFSFFYIIGSLELLVLSMELRYTLGVERREETLVVPKCLGFETVCLAGKIPYGTR